MKAEYVTSIEQWPDVKKIAEEFNTSPWSKRIACTIDDARLHVEDILKDPVHFGMVLVRDECNKVVTIIVLEIVYTRTVKYVDMNTPDDIIIQRPIRVAEPTGFVVAAYNKGHDAAMEFAVAASLKWFKARNCQELEARVRPSAKFDALFSKFGFKKKYYIISRPLRR